MFSLLHRCLKNPRLWQVALACYWVALFVVTHMPIQRLALSRGSADKFAHVAAFGGLAILVAITWRISAGRIHARQLLSVWVLVVLYGAIEETTQPAANRTASLIDWLADTIGATLGAAIFWWRLRPWIDHWVPVAELGPNVEQPTSWRRYSLRTLFVAMTVVAAFCYWMMLPTMNAQAFVRALQKREYATAERLFVDGSGIFPGSFKDHAYFEPHASIAPLTWTNFWTGERHINVAINYGDGEGMATCGADVSADRRGLKLGMIVP